MKHGYGLFPFPLLFNVQLLSIGISPTINDSYHLYFGVIILACNSDYSFGIANCPVSNLRATPKMNSE